MQFSLETAQNTNIFSEASFLFSGWKKKQTWKPLLTQTERAIKNVLKRESVGLEWEILHRAIYVHFQKRKLLKS